MKFLGKGSKLVLSFVRIWMGHAPFSLLPGSLEGQPHCFSAVLRPYIPLEKAFAMSLQTRSIRISNQHVLPALNQSSPSYNFKKDFV